MTDWPVKTLGEVCEVVNGATPDTKVEEYWGGRHAWITPAEMGNLDSPFLSMSRRTLSDEGLASCSASLVPPRTVILSSRAPIGHLVINEVPMATNQGCKSLIPKVGLDFKFLYYYLKANVKLLDSLGTGTTFKELSGTQLKTVDIPVPSLEEQKRIVELLDAATLRIAELRELGSRHSKLETEIQSATVERLLAPEGDWNSRPLNEWCSEIGTGPFGSLVHKADYVETGIPLVNPMNMKEGQIIESGIKRVSPSKAVELNRYILQTGDIVLGRRGEMGRCAVVRSEHNGWICGTGSFFLRPTEDCSPDLLAIWLSSRQGRSALCSISSGTTMDNLGNRELGLLEVAFPDRPTQDDMVSRASALEGLVSEMRIQQHDRSLLLESLQQSILESAFAGEL